MNWISLITLIISALTLIMVGVELFVRTKQRKIDRKIEVVVGERRRMQQELFNNVLGILEIDRQIQYSKLLEEKNVLFNKVLNYKIGVWINLNRENMFADKLRSNCNLLAIWIASSLDETNDSNIICSYLEAANKNRQHIWVLIDKYIEEEEQIIKFTILGKDYNRS